MIEYLYMLLINSKSEYKAYEEQLECQLSNIYKPLYVKITMAKYSNLEIGLGIFLVGSLAYGAISKIPYLREHIYEPAVKSIQEALPKLGDTLLATDHYTASKLMR